MPSPRRVALLRVETYPAKQGETLYRPVYRLADGRESRGCGYSTESRARKVAARVLNLRSESTEPEPEGTLARHLRIARNVERLGIETMDSW